MATGSFMSHNYSSSQSEVPKDHYKLTFLPHILYLRKKCERSLNILRVLSNTLWGADRVSLLRVYQSLILSCLDYGCVVYGFTRAFVIKRLDTVHHSALRICSGAFRTSPVTSLYEVCHQPPLELRRRHLGVNYFIRAMPVPSHPLKPFALAIGLNRLYEARSFKIKPFSERAKAVLNDAHLNNINIQENNILAFPPWDIQIFNYHHPFSVVRYFYVRIGHSSSHKLMQDQGVPQGSVLSVTLFNIHMSNILHQLPPSVRGMLYVD
ncbi:putative RNA-directed DNA polymerase from transposon X-element [Trichonephila clavipes]|nr:putative RNA-directed DNA polymerase from transposon X-element [Trichonephila clavipes]